MEEFQDHIKEDCRRSPFIWIAGLFSLGIIAFEYLRIPSSAAFYLTALCVVSGVILRRKAYLATALIFLSFLFLGSFHACNYQVLASDHISRMSRFFYGHTVALEGIIVSDVEKRNVSRLKKTVFRLKVKQLNVNGKWRRASGEVLVNLFRQDDIHYGDYIFIEGRLHKPFNFSSETNFSYRDYLNRKGIQLIFSVKKESTLRILEKNRGNILMDWAFKLKLRLDTIIQNNFSGVEMGLMQGFLLGDRFNIPEYINQLFQKAGVIHILAVSGFNVGIVAYVMFLLLKMFPIPRIWRYLLMIIILIIYAVITGAQPPVVRATIMACIFLLSLMIEREPKALNTLACAALVILTLNPLNIFDVGFQLSFLSVWAILVFYPRLARLKYFESILANSVKTTFAKTCLKYLTQSALVSFSAYMGVIIPVVYYFQIVTPVSVLANLFVIPLSSLIVILGIALLLAGLIIPAAAFLFANCIKLFLAFMVWITFLCVQIPGAYLAWNNLPLIAVFLYYIVIGLILARELMIDKKAQI